MFRHIQGYWFLFSHIHRRATREKRGGLPCPFWKVKTVLWPWKERPDCVHLWVQFSIQNVALRVFRRKKSKMFSCGASFSCVFDEMFLKISGCAYALRHYSFCKTLYIKCLNVWQCSEYIYLNNWSVICTGTLCTASDTFRILAYSALFFQVYTDIFKHIQCY